MRCGFGRPAGRRFTYLELLSLAEDIASAMAYLHPTVVHRCERPATHRCGLKHRG
jgi:hypothetical protein